MLIPLKADSPDADIQEWALVELQGRIEPMQEPDLQQALQVGTLQLSKTNKDVVQLQVGYHIIEGKRVPLKKPMAILETVQQQQDSSSTGGSHSSADAGHSSSSSSSSSSSTHCKVIGVLRYKFLFKNRPKALISKPQGR